MGSSGGKGGSQTIGYKYYLGLHMAFCHGPVDKVGPIYAGERLAYPDRVTYDGTIGPAPRPTFTPPTGWDLRMELDSDDIDGTLSPWTDAQNVTNVTFGASGATFSAGYMDIGDFDLSDQFTMLFAFTPADAGDDLQLLIGKHTDDGTGGRDIWGIWWQRSTGKLGYSWGRVMDDNDIVFLSDAGTFAAGTEHEVMLIWKRDVSTTLQVIALYRNSVFVNSMSDMESSWSWEGRSWVLGADWDEGVAARDNEYNGVMRDLHIYDDAIKTTADVWPIVSTAGSTEQRIYIDAPDLFGGKKKEGGVQGYVDVCFGADDQGQNSYLLTQDGMTPSTLPAFRGILSLIARKCYVCAMSPYPKPWWVQVENIPGQDWYPSKASINADSNGASANGIHIIRECLINPNWGMGYSTSSINTTNFEGCADTLYDEGFGLSMLLTHQGSIESFIQEVLKHINGILYSDRETGQFKITLIRDDYTVGSLPIFDESNIVSLDSFQRPSFAEMVNEITIMYRRRGEFQDSSVTFQDLASVNAQGSVIPQTLNFIGVDSDDIAAKVGMRELKQHSTPLAQVEITVNREGWNINPGDPIVFKWTPYGIDQLVLRVVKANYGEVLQGKIKLSCVEDVFGLPSASYVTPQAPLWIEPVTDPVAVTQSLKQEATYYELATGLPASSSYVGDMDPAAAFLLYMAKPPTGASSSYELWSYVTGDYTYKAASDYTVTAELIFAVNYEDTTFRITDISFGAEEIEVGSYAFIDDEIVRIDAIDLDTNEVTVGRGCIDTVPAMHSIGAEIWFGKDNWAFDYTEYAQGDTVNIKALTKTGLGILAIGDATAESLAMVGRAYKPYPVAKVGIQTAANYYPVFVYGSDATLIYWANRNRLQQTVVNSITDWYDSNITPEAGLTYTFKWYSEFDLNASTPTKTETGITGTSHQWPDEIGDSNIGAYSPPDDWDLHMPLASDDIGGTLSPWTDAQNVTDVTFTDRATFADGYMDIGDFSLTTAAFSMSFIFTPVDTGDDYQLLIGKHTSGDQDIICLYWRRTTAQLYLGYGTTMTAIGFEGSIKPGRKHEILLTRNSSLVTIYLSSQQLGQQSVSISSWTGRSWVLGADWVAAARDNLYNGTMWDLRIWDNAVKTTSDIWPTTRVNRYYRLAITSVRDATDSLQDYDFTVTDRGGWGLDWGNNFNGRQS